MPAAAALVALGLAVPAGARDGAVRIPGRLVHAGRATFAVGSLRKHELASVVAVYGTWRVDVPVGRVLRAERSGVLRMRLGRPRHLARSAPLLVAFFAASAAATAPDPPPSTPPAGASATAAPDPSPGPDAAQPAQPAPPAPQSSDDATLSPAPPGAKATLQPPGTPVLSDAEAAAHVARSAWEPRPENDQANAVVPTADEIAAFRAAAPQVGTCPEMWQHVTGDFTGTTDEIIQWAAWKWGLDEDVFRADAAVETWWRQGFVGDDDHSYGLMQIKKTVHTGTYPLSQRSTAFNADYYAAMIRQYYDGCETWLNSVDHGRPYAAGDLWGSLGAWYAGRWHTAAADRYVGAVQKDLERRVWERPSFASHSR